MTTNFRRIALLTGVSAAALGISNVTATAALAAPQGLTDGTYSGSATVDDIVEICELTGPVNPTGPTPPCFTGVIDTSLTAATAVVNSTANGQMLQSDSDGSAFISVTGVATVGAYATAEPLLAGKSASANAFITDAVRQTGANATTLFASADYDFVIEPAPGAGTVGRLNIEAFARAEAFGTGIDASAYATVIDGLRQEASFPLGDVDLDIENNGYLTVAAIAFAAAPDNAQAVAINSEAIEQDAFAGSSANVAFLNTGEVNVLAQASAGATGTGLKSGEAFAYASVDSAIHQIANGDTNASVDLTNDGSIEIAAIARANGAVAQAEALVDHAIMQEAYSTNTAAIELNNNGLLSINGLAVAYGTQDGGLFIGGAAANAIAFGDDLIEQYASADGLGGGNASVRIDNGAGDVIAANFTAYANGRGEGGNGAFAYASVNDFIEQDAISEKSGAQASIVNGGTISLDVNAVALAISDDGLVYGDAVAYATIDGGIDQEAIGKSGATAYLSNGDARVISINADAYATGGLVYAGAIVDDAIAQAAYASDGDALASILNDGLIDIGAHAQVTGDAEAYAEINGGIAQNAFAAEYDSVYFSVPAAPAALVASVGPDANVTLVNNGVIDIHATALAHDTVTGTAEAGAVVRQAIEQFAYATAGEAGVEISGSGSISILAYASAIADGGAAEAYATVEWGAIDQTAISYNTNAFASGYFSQGGGVDIRAIANAYGTDGARATAFIASGIDQNIIAYGTDGADGFGGEAAVAIADINNSATINIVAQAQADGGGFYAYNSSVFFPEAFAYATVDFGIQQYVTAAAKSGALGTFTGYATASASLDNSGIINIGATAYATAAQAEAFANVDVGIEQDVNALGGTAAVADNDITNDGAINIFAVAVANGTANFSGDADAEAEADIDWGIRQEADAAAKSGTGIASNGLINDGDISVIVDASAVATGLNAYGTLTVGDAVASANLNGAGIYQRAFSYGTAQLPYVTVEVANVESFASNSIVNTGSIVFVADADAVGASASAYAGIDDGIMQVAQALGVDAAYASNAIVNADGALIAVQADALADGLNWASATASIDHGIAQYASASAKSGTAAALASIDNGGDIVVNANAIASAESGSAYASASVDQGIRQDARANGGDDGVGTATAFLDNSGSIVIGAYASAFADDSAEARAVIVGGIEQNVEAADNGYATLINTGYVTVLAVANATGDELTNADVYAQVVTAIAQNVDAFGGGGAAVASAYNSGAILIGADAVAALASGGSASADAFVNVGIAQRVAGYSSALAVLENTGSIDVVALASASGDDDVSAYAWIGTAILQDVDSFGGGDGYSTAAAQVVNTGSIRGIAEADALGGGEVDAYAFVNDGIVQLVDTTGVGEASVFNGGYISMLADAAAIGGQTGTASASAQAIRQRVDGDAGASAAVTNEGSLIVSANADLLVGNAAQKGASASAFAFATGVEQEAYARDFASKSAVVFTDEFGPADVTSANDVFGFSRDRLSSTFGSGPASARFENTGTFQVTADAAAVGDDFAEARAEAFGVSQQVLGSDAYATAINAGDMLIAAGAYASGDNGAFAFASAAGIFQSAVAGDITYATETDGYATVHLATGYETVIVGVQTSAYRTVTFGALAEGYAQAVVDNSGSLVVGATATANVNLGAGDGITTLAGAVATAAGIAQFVVGETAIASVDNSGYLTVLANAEANGATAATAFAGAVGIVQGAGAADLVEESFQHREYVTVTTRFGHTDTFVAWVETATETTIDRVGLASALVDNSGTIDVGARADAFAGSTASAFAIATGIVQAVIGTEANAQVINSGEINVIADAYASGTYAFASASAQGIVQALDGTEMNAGFDNTGEFAVLALAEATGTSGTALAYAGGLSAQGTGGGTLNVDIFNGGEFLVGAEAISAGGAYATAQGIVLGNAPTVSGTDLLGNPITGYLTNDGAFDVVALASGGTGSSAYATGISVASGVNTMVITNTGSINVDAITTNGGNAQATGIYVTANGDTVPLVGEVLTINNDGDIIVRESSDGGDTFFRGMAIDVATAPNNTVINLLSGNIYGNIDVQDGDAINVIVDETVFNGIINPECMPAGGPTALQLDNPAQNLCGEGDLTLADGGTFHMVIDPNEGPSYAFVNTLTVEEDGTLELDLPPADGTAPIGTYPQIFADVVTLNGGTLIANIQTPNNGLYETTVYENVIDGLDLTGTFDQCLVTGVPATSLLLDFGCVYDNLDNVDLRLTRTPFDLVPGLNDNGTSVGEGLECIYDVTLTGGIADMLADLFLFTDPVNYNIALNQLSGSVYANYLQSFPSLGVHHNDILAKATDCEIPALAGSVLECRASSGLHLWGQADYQWRKADGDEEAGTAKSKRASLVVGLDTNVGAAGIIGGSIGYVTNHVRDNQFGDNADADGLQVGLYGVYDPGTFYVKGMTTYSWYDGDFEPQHQLQRSGSGRELRGQPER